MAWPYLDLWNCFKDSNFHHCLSHQTMSSEAGFPSVSLENSAISPPPWHQGPLTFQQPKYHFIVSNVESHESIQLTSHWWEQCMDCTDSGCTRKDGSPGFSTKACKSGKGASGVRDIWGPSLSCLWLKQSSSFFFPLATTTSTLQYPLSFYLNLRSKPQAGFWRATCVVKKASGWNMAPVIPSQRERGNNSREGSQCNKCPSQQNFAFRFLL